MDLPRLIELRRDKHVTQKVLANLLDITVAAYGRYESGQAEPSLSSLVKLAKFFEVSIDYLMGLTDAKNVSMHTTKYSQLSPKDQEIIDSFTDRLLEKNK